MSGKPLTLWIFLRQAPMSPWALAEFLGRLAQASSSRNTDPSAFCRRPLRAGAFWLPISRDITENIEQRQRRQRHFEHQRAELNERDSAIENHRHQPPEGGEAPARAERQVDQRLRQQDARLRQRRDRSRPWSRGFPTAPPAISGLVCSRRIGQRRARNSRQNRPNSTVTAALAKASHSPADLRCVEFDHGTSAFRGSRESSPPRSAAPRRRISTASSLTESSADRYRPAPARAALLRPVGQHRA